MVVNSIPPKTGNARAQMLLGSVVPVPGASREIPFLHKSGKSHAWSGPNFGLSLPSTNPTSTYTTLFMRSHPLGILSQTKPYIQHSHMMLGKVPQRASRHEYCVYTFTVRLQRHHPLHFPRYPADILVSSRVGLSHSP
jgi:hypothetical protein